jgi:hypothetical protein
LIYLVPTGTSTVPVLANPSLGSDGGESGSSLISGLLG